MIAIDTFQAHVLVSHVKQTSPVVVAPTLDGYTPEYQPGVVAAHRFNDSGQFASTLPDAPWKRTQVADGNNTSSHVLPYARFDACRVASFILV